MSSFFKKYILIIKYTLKNYSLLRILQILETAKIIINGTILDLGANANENNITNFLNKNANIIYADKFPKNNSLFIDLEINLLINRPS